MDVKALDVSPDELKRYDTRAIIADLNGFEPKDGLCVQNGCGNVEKVKNGELTGEDIIAKLIKRKSRGAINARRA